MSAPLLVGHRTGMSKSLFLHSLLWVTRSLCCVPRERAGRPDSIPGQSMSLSLSFSLFLFLFILSFYVSLSLSLSIFFSFFLVDGINWKHAFVQLHRTLNPQFDSGRDDRPNSNLCRFQDYRPIVATCRVLCGVGADSSFHQSVWSDGLSSVMDCFEGSILVHSARTATKYNRRVQLVTWFWD